MTREQIEQRITEISEFLKGSGIPYLERQMLHEERKDLRAELERNPTPQKEQVKE